MTCSRSPRGPEPSEHPGAGWETISLIFWDGDHRDQSSSQASGSETQKVDISGDS